MKRQPLLILAAALLVCGTAATAVSAAVAANDPLVTQSYAVGGYLETIKARAGAAAQAVLAQKVTPQLEQTEAAYSETATRAALEQRVLAALGGGGAMTDVQLAANKTVTCQAGAELCLTAGSASVTRGTLINLSEGRAVTAPGTLVRNQIYLAADDGTVLQMTGSGTLRIAGSYQIGQAAGGTQESGVRYTAYADALNTLGLFQGSGKGYELSRASTRVEGVVMLIRLLGRETEARQFTGSHPFTDVPAWADPYVAYAYRQGYTSGISSTEFGASMELRYRDYMTFLLRALGYSDRNGDFSWSTADQMAVSVGIQTASERSAILSSGKFLRDHVAYTSFRALFTKTTEGRRMCDALLLRGAISQDALIDVEEKGL